MCTVKRRGQWGGFSFTGGCAPVASHWRGSDTCQPARLTATRLRSISVSHAAGPARGRRRRDAARPRQRAGGCSTPGSPTATKTRTGASTARCTQRAGAPGACMGSVSAGGGGKRRIRVQHGSNSALRCADRTEKPARWWPHPGRLTPPGRAAAKDRRAPCSDQRPLSCGLDGPLPMRPGRRWGLRRRGTPRPPGSWPTEPGPARHGGAGARRAEPGFGAGQRHP